jgi:hypothetical protein
MATRSLLDPPPQQIFVLDAGAVIRVKNLVKVDDQWAILDTMMSCVRSGEMCFPRQVATELSDLKFPDAPGAWAGHAKSLVRHREPHDHCVARVLSSTPDLIDPDATGPEPADPYVVAMALDLLSVYPASRVLVASDDKVDRPPLRMSVKTACDRLDIGFCEPEEFIGWVRQRLAFP